MTNRIEIKEIKVWQDIILQTTANKDREFYSKKLLLLSYYHSSYRLLLKLQYRHIAIG